MKRSAKDVWKVIELALTFVKESPVIIILDAVDDCDSKGRHRVFQALESLCKLETWNVKAFVTAQPIEEVIGGFNNIQRQSISLDPRDRATEPLSESTW